MVFREQTLDVIVFDFLPHVYIELNGKPVLFLVDTGADSSVITRQQM